MYFGTWPIRMLMDSDISKWPEQQKVIIAQELVNYGIGIATPSEKRLVDEGTLRDSGGGHRYSTGRKSQKINLVFMEYVLPL